jgi:uncharacterized protein (TIGR03118 family)
MKQLLFTGLAALVFAGWCPAANKYVQHNLVSDIAGAADHTDPCLINPWGITFSPNSPFWVSANGSGLSTIYDGNGNAASLIVQVPGSAGAQGSGQQCGKTPFGAGAPSGIVFNNSASFLLGTSPASFLFSSEQGMIAGWNGAAAGAGKIMADRSASGSVYKGLAIATRSEGPLLYVADFGNGKVDVFDGGMKLVLLPGAFVDSQIPAGFAPFNIQNLGGSLYVSYARQDAAHHDDVPGQGSGYVDVYDLNGLLLSRLIAGGPLNSPWGLALAPAGFGDFGGALLVGNFGDGSINAFNAVTGAFLGPLQGDTGNAIHISGLWGLTFGNGSRANSAATPTGGDANTLYFTAGIAGPDTVESHGLLGALQPAPVVSMNGVVNAASSSAPIAPGAFTAIFGNGLAATTRTWNSADFPNGKPPVQLDGVSVTINGKAAYIYFVSPNQVDVIAPADSATGPVPVILTNNHVAAPSVVALLQTVSPALFADGKYVVATHANGTLVGPANVLPGATPAKPGETIAMYGTGFGPTNQTVDGLVVTAPADLTALPSVTIGNTPAIVTFAWRSAAGLDQINVTVPGLPAGTAGTVDLPIRATSGASGSQPELLITLESGN